MREVRSTLRLPSLALIAAIVAAGCGGGSGARVATPEATPPAGIGATPVTGAAPATPTGTGPARPGQAIEVPQTDATPPPPPRGVLAGTVKAMGTDQPIARARVILSADPALLPFPRVVMTEANGTFRFTDLPAGNSFLVTVSKTGFAPRAYGEAPPAVPPSLITLAQDEAKSDLNIVLAPHVSIGGRILDEDGTPFAGAFVEAMRAVFEGQRRTLVTVAEAVTDDRGEFRLVGLPPGQYYVSATDPAFANVGDKDGPLFYSPTFYPGVVFPDEATRITLDPGVASERLEFKLRIIRPARVQGSIATPVEGLGASKPLLAASVLMSPLRNDQFSLFTLTEPTMEPGGRFLFANVPPGRYRIMASGETEREGITRFSLFTLDVAGEDRINADMVLSQGADVWGHVEWDSATGRIPTDRSTLIVRMPMEDGNEFGDSVTGVIGANNTWRVRGAMTGRHYFRVDGLPPGWQVKRVEYQGADITDTPWMFNYDEVVKGIKIVLTDRTTTLRGFVVPHGRDDIRSYAVVAFPVSPLLWRPLSRHVKLTYPDANGQYEIRGLPPGNYMLAATRAIDPSDLGRPQAFDLLLAQKGVVSFTLREHQTLRQDVQPVINTPGRNGER